MKILDLSSEHLSGSPKDAASLLCDEEPVAIFINGRQSQHLLGSETSVILTGYLFTEQYIQNRR
jgi:formate dehydrogenase assembly factor FdhD